MNIVTLISSYKEGSLIQGAIRSASVLGGTIIVREGCTEKLGVRGDKTELGSWEVLVDFNTGRWNSEAVKRTEMIDYARTLIEGEFWILTLDADEILIWGEYLIDWLNVLQPGKGSSENVPALKLTENFWVPPLPIVITDRPQHKETYGERQVGFWTDRAPSHLFHSSMFKRYTVGAWQFETTDGQTGYLERTPSPNMPAYGEPHIHHRPYLRRYERASMRSNQGEEQRWLDSWSIKRK